MSNLKRDGQLRWSPSYLRNRGQVTRAQKRALREGWNRFGLTFRNGEILDLETAFGSDSPLVIEIGFGMGDHLLHLAETLPDHRVLGIEVHRPGLAAATARLLERDLENVRLIRGDARLILTDHCAPAIAHGVIVQFPDPWPKPGDEHRRLIQPGMVEVLHRCLVPEGEFLLATDVEDYAEHARRVFEESSGWKECERSRFREHRIPTPYEKKGHAEGRCTHELIYLRTRDEEL